MSACAERTHKPFSFLAKNSLELTVDLFKIKNSPEIDARADPKFLLRSEILYGVGLHTKCVRRGSPQEFFLNNFKAIITQRITDIKLHMRQFQKACNVRFSDIFHCLSEYHWLKFYKPGCKCTNILVFFCGLSTRVLVQFHVEKKLLRRPPSHAKPSLNDNNKNSIQSNANCENL